MRLTCCYTSFTFSYLSRARILAQTLKLAHPDWWIYALLVDEVPDGFDAKAGLSDFDEVMFSDELPLPRYRAWLFKHDIVEACTAVKGHMLVHLLEQGWEKVVYLDPDIGVFDSLSGIVDRLDTSSIILTPHQVDPNLTDISIRDNEITSLQYGVYNLGFVAVRNDTNGHAFASWWAAQLYRACYDEVESGIFTDQKYCDLVPSFFDKVFVDRDPGYNVASWNLSRRSITFPGDGRILVNESPLKFYHFTKIGSAGDGMTERYAGDNTEVFEVWNWYKRALIKNTLQGIPNRYWRYNTFTNGVKILKQARVFYRSRSDLMEYFDDPFEANGNSLYNWLKRERGDLVGDPLY
jgi:hypothetical protein